MILLVSQSRVQDKENINARPTVRHIDAEE